MLTTVRGDFNFIFVCRLIFYSRKKKAKREKKGQLRIIDSQASFRRGLHEIHLAKGLLLLLSTILNQFIRLQGGMEVKWKEKMLL